jgi:hypothetical protein
MRMLAGWGVSPVPSYVPTPYAPYIHTHAWPGAKLGPGHRTHAPRPPCSRVTRHRLGWLGHESGAEGGGMVHWPHRIEGFGARHHGDSNHSFHSNHPGVRAPGHRSCRTPPPALLTCTRRRGMLAWRARAVPRGGQTLCPGPFYLHAVSISHVLVYI